MPQQAVREAAGRRADIETAKSSSVDMEFFKSLFKFQATSADIARFRTFSLYANRHIVLVRLGRFFHAMLVNKYHTGHDHCLCFGS